MNNSVIFYNNLKKDYLKYNCWKTEQSFPIENIEENILNEFCVQEYIYSGVFSNRTKENYNKQLSAFKKGVLDILNNEKRNVYLFKIEHKPQIINRIRSYKGLIDKKKVPSSIYKEKELIINENESIIAAVVKLDDNSIKIEDYIPFDSTNGFLISTNNNYLNDNFILDVTNLFDINNYIDINYWNLVITYCSKGDSIFRIGGDSGDEYWSLQKFRLYSD